jgi:hypothetical protein
MINLSDSSTGKPVATFSRAGSFYAHPGGDTSTMGYHVAGSKNPAAGNSAAAEQPWSLHGPQFGGSSGAGSTAPQPGGSIQGAEDFGKAQVAEMETRESRGVNSQRGGNTYSTENNSHVYHVANYAAAASPSAPTATGSGPGRPTMSYDTDSDLEV